MIVGSEDVPTGDEPHPLGLVRQGRHRARRTRPGPCRSTTATRKVGEAQIKTQLGAFAIAGAGAVRRPARRRAGHRRLPRASRRTRSPAARSTGSPSTSAASRTSTSSAKPRCCSGPNEGTDGPPSTRRFRARAGPRRLPTRNVKATPVPIGLGAPAHRPNTSRTPLRGSRLLAVLAESAILACRRGLEGLEGTGCPLRSTLVMKGSAVRIRASARRNTRTTRVDPERDQVQRVADRRLRHIGHGW